jgi:hypothetical protein
MLKIYDKAYGPTRNGGGDNYRTIESRLANHQSFTGNSMSARRDEDDSYIVLSYSTVIATVRPTGEIEIADNLWGRTTGRHINLCKRCL